MVPLEHRSWPAEAGVGVLSLVLAVSIVAVLAVLAMSSVDYTLEAPVPENVLPPGTDGSAPAAPDAARQLACEANYKLVAEALARKQALDGALPLTLEELVAEGWLDPSSVSAAPGMSLEVVDGKATGTVLVNGRAGPGGCSME